MPSLRKLNKGITNITLLLTLPLLFLLPLDFSHIPVGQDYLPTCIVTCSNECPENYGQIYVTEGTLIDWCLIFIGLWVLSMLEGILEHYVLRKSQSIKDENENVS